MINLWTQIKLKLSILLFLIFLTHTLLMAQNTTTLEIQLPVDSLQVVFLANINANYENCLCGQPPLGGLDRIITVVHRWRKQNPNLLLLDGGDFLNAYPYPALNRLIFKLYSLLHPNVVCLGDQEVQEGNKDLQKELLENGFKVLGTNLKLKHLPVTRRIGIKLASNNRIAILSYLDSSAFLWAKPSEQVQLAETAFEHVYRQSLNPKEFRIVVFHGDRDRLALFLKRYPQVHLVLLAHAQERVFEHTSLPWILGPGTDSEYLTRISLIFKKRKSLPQIKLKTVPIALKIKPDGQAEQMIQKFKDAAK